MGRLVDLSLPGTPPPSPVIVDANIVSAFLLASFPGQDPLGPPRAAQFIQGLIAFNGVGLVTPTAFNEFVHVAIKALYHQAVATHQPALTAAYGPRKKYSWLDQYKLDPTILRHAAPGLERLRQQLAANNLLCLGHDDLAQSTPIGPYDRDLIQLVGRYGLDTNDAAILLEAQRVGVDALVTLDADLRRAQADFDIFTWL